MDDHPSAASIGLPSGGDQSEPSEPRPLPSRTDLYGRIRDSRGRSLLLAAAVMILALGYGVVVGLALDAFLFAMAAVSAVATGRAMELGSFRGWLDLPIGLGLLGAVLCLPVITFAWFRSHTLVLAKAGVRPTQSPREKVAADVVAELALAAGLPTPAVAIIDEPAPNAMSAGSGPRKTTVVVTTGLLELLDRRRLQAVVGHELAHALNGDLRFHTFFAALIAYLARLQALLSQGRLSVVAWSLTLCRRLGEGAAMAAFRQREFMADDVGVLLCRDPQALIDALRTIGAAGIGQHLAVPEITNLFIVSPQDPAAENPGWGDPHPALRERIRRLGQLV